MKYILLDIDGCIIDLSLRWQALQRGEITVEEYERIWRSDKLLRAGVALYKALLTSYPQDCLFVTARKERQRSATVDALRAFLGVDGTPLLMRADDAAYVPSTKLEILRNAKISPKDVLFAVDDDPMILNAYQSVGIDTLQAFFRASVQSPKVRSPAI